MIRRGPQRGNVSELEQIRRSRPSLIEALPGEVTFGYSFDCQPGSAPSFKPREYSIHPTTTSTMRTLRGSRSLLSRRPYT